MRGLSRPRPSRRRVAALVAALVLAGLGACGGGGDDGDASPALATRTVEAGEVTVKLSPQRIDAGGAAFRVVLDTHSVDLSVDLPDAARLRVDASDWAAVAWDGPGPGGHHREGTLRFDARGPATNEAVLTLDGLPEPVRVTWRLSGR